MQQQHAVRVRIRLDALQMSCILHLQGRLQLVIIPDV
jgi:hypothetical protein